MVCDPSIRTGLLLFLVKIVEVCLIFMWESGGKVKVRGLWMGWDGLWLDDDHDVVQIGSNSTSSLILFTLAQPQPGDTVIWLMTSLYSVRISPSFIPIQHTVHKHIYSLLTCQFN